MSGLVPPNFLAYVGQVVVPFINKPFPPTSSFNDFNIPTVWIDTANEIAYLLVGKPLGVANWVQLAAASGNLNTLTADTGGAISPIANNITLAGGVGISTAGNNGTATITFNSHGGGMTWNDVSGISASMSANNGYVSDNGALVTLTLPTTAAFGDVIAIVGKGAGGWTLAQNTNQQIFCGNKSTTMGVGGSVSSTNRRDAIYLVCTTANLEFTTMSSVGNLTLI